MRTLQSKLIQFGQELIENRGRGFLFLYPLSFLWGSVVFCKNWLYSKNIFSPRKMSQTVISVGNLVAGGTGKTPLTLFLAQHFSHQRVAILSRGYGAQGLLADEPALLAQRCPSAQIYLGKDRRLSAQQAIDQKANILILDDGFQHRKIFRDFDLLLLSTKDPFGRGSGVFDFSIPPCYQDHPYLPRGYLRDSPQRLKEASAIFLNPIESEEQLESWNFYLGVSIPLIGVRLETLKVVGGALSGLCVGLFCGIAHPKNFKNTVIDLGAIVVGELVLADHEGPSPQNLTLFANHAKSLGAKALVCTEKDFVKLSLPVDFPIPIIYLEMELKITAGYLHWQNLVDKIEEKINNCKYYER